MIRFWVGFMTAPITDPVAAFGYRIWAVAGVISMLRFFLEPGICY